MVIGSAQRPGGGPSQACNRCLGEKIDSIAEVLDEWWARRVESPVF